MVRSKGTLVGRRALAGTILGMTVYPFWRLCYILTIFSLKFPKLTAPLQKPVGLSTLPSNLAKPSQKPSL